MRGGPPDDEGPLAALKAFGATPEVLAEAKSALVGRRSAPLRIWPAHWDAWVVFRSQRTQWLVHIGQRGLLWQGLNYQRLESTVRLLRIKKKHRRELFGQIRVMEAAAVSELAKG